MTWKMKSFCSLIASMYVYFGMPLLYTVPLCTLCLVFFRLTKVEKERYEHKTNVLALTKEHEKVHT